MQWLDDYEPFEYQTSPLFSSPLHRQKYVTSTAFWGCFVIFEVTINKVLFIFLSFFIWSFRNSFWTCLFVEASQRSDVMRIYGSMNRFDPLPSTVHRIILDDRLEFHQDRIDAAGVGKLQKKQSTFSNNKHQVLIVGCHYWGSEWQTSE